MELWLTRSRTAAPAHATPRWKVAVLVWIGLVPTLLAFAPTVGPLVEELPLVPRVLVTAAILVPVMTWIVMPVVTAVFRRWLHR